MRTQDAEASFRAFLDSRGAGVDTVSAEELVRSMVDWFEFQRVDDVDIESNGDMLLFQWGTYAWRGGSPEFEIDITRQFIVDGLVDDDAFFQLSWTARYTPSAATERAGEGNLWCDSPAQTASLLEFVAHSEAMAAVAGIRPAGVELHFGGAG